MEKEQLQQLIENNKDDLFSEIKEEISDESVTDIEWDGYKRLLYCYERIK